MNVGRPFRPLCAQFGVKWQGKERCSRVNQSRVNSAATVAWSCLLAVSGNSRSDKLAFCNLLRSHEMYLLVSDLKRRGINSKQRRSNEPVEKECDREVAFRALLAGNANLRDQSDASRRGNLSAIQPRIFPLWPKCGPN